MSGDADMASFARRLTGREFGEFFVYPAHDQTVDRIWEDATARQLLDRVLNDPSTSNEARLLACEVLFKKDILFMRRHAPEKVAEIYARALSDNLTGMANSWGLLYDKQDDGPLGIAFLTIGERAIPALSKLLDDERRHLKYQGSVEATVGNSYRYRVKDFAAYYIGRIRGKPLKYYPDPAARDQQIDELKKELGFGAA